VRFGGLDEPLITGGTEFLKSLDIDHARDGEVMIAFAMNGEQLPLLNGFPLKLVVPGWSAVYWVKMLNDIEVLDQPDTNYWTSDRISRPRHAERDHDAGAERREAGAGHAHAAPILFHEHRFRAPRCTPVRRRRRVASPSAAIVAWRAWICRSMEARAGS